MSSEGPKAPHLRLAEHPSLRFARVSAHPTLGTPRFRSASLGVTAFAVMLSGGAASPAVETSRPIGTFTHHEPYTQCVASDVRSFLQSFARGGCGLPAQSAESTGCHLERSDSGVERSRHSGTVTDAVQHGFRSSGRRDPSTSLGMTCRGTSFGEGVFSVMLSEGRSPQSRHPDAAGHSPSRFARALANTILGAPRLHSG